MTDTANLGLPCIDAAQAQKHVTHNEALRLLDTLVQLAVLDRDLTAPPGSPVEGQRWIVNDAAPSGTWAGHGNDIAAWQDGGWQFSTPLPGWLAYVVDESLLIAWDGDSWQSQIARAPYDALAHNNVVVNAALDVSQELGTTGATLASGTEKYVADCFEAQYVHGAGTGVVTSAQVASASFPAPLAGFRFGHQIKAMTAIASPANGDYAKHRTKIEGYRIAHWGWGAAGAADIVVAFNLYSTAAGTAFVKLSNSDQSRCYYHEIAVATGWNFYAFTVPGDSGGAWQATTATGLTFEIFVSGKAASPASSLDTWGSIDSTQTTNSTNLLGADNNLTILTGLFVAPGSQLPLASDLSKLMLPFAESLRLCQRYWATNVAYGNIAGNAGGSGVEAPRYAMFAWSSTSLDTQRISFPVPMRTTPTLTFYSANIPGASDGNWQIYDGVSTWQTGTSITAASQNEKGFVAEVSGFTVATKCAYIGYGVFAADARL
jgi:hypothetical protein